MHLEDFDSDTGKRVWLSQDELDLFLECVDGNEQHIALGLAARSGLRTDEITRVAPEHVVNGPADRMVRVWAGKGEKYRETPIPEGLAIRIEAVADESGQDSDEPIVDRPTRTIRRWVKSVGEECRQVTDDAAWEYLSPHDLRRSWAQSLLDSGVEPGMVMVWGGWENWKTFREHYIGKYSPDRQRSEREKAAFL